MSKLTPILISASLVLSPINVAYGVELQVKENPGELVTLKDIEIVLPEQGGTISFYGVNRSRVYMWDYFSGGSPDNEYIHGSNQLRLGTKWDQEWLSLHAAFQHVELLNLPSPTSPGAGTGALYFANGDGSRSPHGSYLKYLHLDTKDFLDIGLTTSTGRFDFANGVSYKTGSGSGYENGDPSPGVSETINWVKSKRIGQRVLGGFGWSEHGRSFDGSKFSWDTEPLNVTFAAFSPTQGGFEERAGRRIDGIDVTATEATFKKDLWPINLLFPNTEVQLFHYSYLDSRTISATTARHDNTGRSVIGGTEHDVEIQMFGGHLVGATDVGPGRLDYLLWGGYQDGDWFELDHEAYAFAAEIGYQFLELPWKPWVRGGFNLGSGDGDAGDGKHESFYQMLPTARLYSSSILYNMMNNEDVFAMLVLKPTDTITVRADVHVLKLQESADRWYVGAGPVSLNRAAGYAGRSSGGFDDLGTLIDLGVWWKVCSDVTIAGYYGHFFGSDVTNAFYAADDDADFGYVEIALKF